MKNTILASALALTAMFATSCDLDVGSGTSSSELEAARAQATSNTSTSQSESTSQPTGSTSPAAKPASPTTTAPVAKSAPTPAPAPAPAPAPVVPISTGGSLYQAGGNSITLRSDFAAVAARVDALTTVNETAPGKASSVRVAATRSGNTWVIPQSLYSYPVGNRPNTWRIVLSGTPPAGVTYHTSIMQAFVRTTDIGTGKTYPPTTRR